MAARRPPLAAALAAGALAAAGCVHAHHVADGDRSEQEKRVERGPSPRAEPGRIPPRGDRPAVAASPEGLMNPGASARIQEALRARKYLDDVSGRLDEPTSAALRRFQHDQGLAETGAPDRETLRRLGIDPRSVYQTARPGGAG